MNTAELISEICASTGLSRAQVQTMLSAQREVVLAALQRGDDVPVPGLGRLSSRWQEARTLRTLVEQRKMMLDGRFVPRYKPSKAVRDALLSRTPQLWKDPAHQAAWRVCETLIGDLNLYHKDKAPAFNPDADLDAVQRQCEAAFGPLWTRVVHAYESQVPAAVRTARAYLLLSARRRWSTNR